MSSVLLQGLLASLVAGLVTGVGGFMIFLKKKYTQDNINCMLNIAAGVMLAASFFGLLVPSMHKITTFHPDIHIAGFWFCGAVFVGVALVWLLNDRMNIIIWVCMVCILHSKRLGSLLLPSHFTNFPKVWLLVSLTAPKTL